MYVSHVDVSAYVCLTHKTCTEIVFMQWSHLLQHKVKLFLFTSQNYTPTKSLLTRLLGKVWMISVILKAYLLWSDEQQP